MVWVGDQRNLAVGLLGIRQRGTEYRSGKKNCLTLNPDWTLLETLGMQ